MECLSADVVVRNGGCMREQRKMDAVRYLKRALQDLPDSVPNDIKVSLGEMIVQAYLQGRDDEALVHTPRN